MDTRKSFLTSLFLFFFTALWCQIPFKGELRLGDTTQVHLLTTKDGSRLVGRVIGFDQEKVSFEMKNKAVLSFQADEIASIEVQAEPRITETEPLIGQMSGKPEDLGPGGLYTITYRNGDKRIGQITRINRESFKIILKKGSYDYVSFDRIEYFALTSGRFTDESPVRAPQVLQTIRGDRFVGQVTGYQDGTVDFLLENKTELHFPLNMVEFVRPVEEAPLEERLVSNGSQSLFFTGTGFRLKKGDTEYRNSMILHNTIDHGVNDNLSVGAGVSTVLYANLLMGRLKLGLDGGKNLHFSLGAQAGGVFVVANEPIGVAFGYAAVSLGPEDRFITLSTGRGVSSEGDPVNGFSAGASIRVASHWRLMGEYINFQPQFDSNVSIATLGASWFNSKSRLDFGFSLIPFDSDTEYFPFPVAMYSYKF